jgi:glycosyltransferase involved in cell wall biosynthesis
MPAPTVSVILPVFNQERYLADSIESVLNQTFADWELVMVDDGSSDSTPAIIERYRLRHPEKVRSVAQRNMGVAAARNSGIRASTGELVAFIDGDDLWHPRKLEQQVEVVRARAGVAFVYTGYEVFDSLGRSLETIHPDPRFQGDIYEKLWTEDNRILGPTIMATRKLLDQVGLFDERLPAGENLDLRIKLARLGPVAFVDDTLYRYRKHPESLSADWPSGLKYLRRLIDHHFADPRTPREVELRRRALSRYYQQQANAHFATAEFMQALAWYGKSWAGSRKRGELLMMGLRCFLGRPGNAFLRRLRRRDAAARGIGAGH